MPSLIEQIKQSVKRYLHRGSTYTCPFCNYSARDLAPIGVQSPLFEKHRIVGSGRRFGGCYVCRSSDRERLVFAYLHYETDFFQRKDQAVLHLAPEEFLQKEILKHAFTNYVCGDFFTAGYAYADFVQHMDVTDLPLKDASFDWVICNHVLEHVTDDGKAMRELFRILKPGGRAVLQVPYAVDLAVTFEDPTITLPEARTAHYGQFDHVRLYGADYPDRLRAAGFEVKLRYLAESYPTLGVHAEEALFEIRKPR